MFRGKLHFGIRTKTRHRFNYFHIFPGKIIDLFFFSSLWPSLSRWQNVNPAVTETDLSPEFKK